MGRNTVETGDQLLRMVEGWFAFDPNMQPSTGRRNADKDPEHVAGRLERFAPGEKRSGGDVLPWAARWISGCTLTRTWRALRDHPRFRGSCGPRTDTLADKNTKPSHLIGCSAISGSFEASVAGRFGRRRGGGEDP